MNNTIKKLVLFLLCICFTTSVYADPPAPFPIEINSQSRVAPEVWTFRNNVRTFRATFKDGTNTVNLSGATPFMSWSTNELSSGVVTSSWALVNTGTGGVVDFTFAAAALNYATITNVYEIGVAGSVAVYNRGIFLIKPSPFSTGTNVQPFVTNQNLSGMSFVNAPWFENLTLTTGGSAYVWSGTGTTRNLNVPTASAAGTGTVNEIVSGSSTRLFVTNATGPQVTVYFDGTGLATGTPLYVETFTGSVGSIAGLATGTPLYVEADTNALAQLSATSTVFESRIDGVEAYTSRVVTLEGYTSRVVATEGYTNRAASALSSSVWNVAESTTNAAPLNGWITTNAAFEARLDIVEPYTDRVVAVEGYTNRAASALSSSVWALADSTSNATPRNSWIVTNAAFEARIDTLETGSYTKVEGYASNAQFTVTLTNHEGRIAIIETGRAAQVNFVASNVVWETRVDALETGRAYQADYVATSNIVAILNTNAVVRDTTSGQETMGALHSRDRLSALTNLIVAATNAPGAEVLNNGTFTGSEAGWSLTNASYNANNVLVLPSATASITYTQAVITAGKVYQLSFANTLAYGSNFTLFAVSIGGFTNVFPYAPTGTHTMTVATWTEQPLVFRATPGTNQLVIDTVSLKEDVIGDLWVARRGVFGRDVNVGGNITVASNITAGTISGPSPTGAVAKVGDTMTGQLNIMATGAMKSLVVQDTTNHIYVGDGAAAFGVSSVGADPFLYSAGAGSIAAGTKGIGTGTIMAAGSGSIAIGAVFTNAIRATGRGSVAIGDSSRGSILALAQSSIAIGPGANATDQYAFVFSGQTGSQYNSHGSNSFNISALNGVWVSESMVFDSFGRHTGDGSQLTNLTAANLAAGGTFGALNAANLTNLPSAATTAGVNSLVLDVTNSFTGNTDFDDSAEIDSYKNGSNGVSWLIQSASIVSSKLAAAVWAGIEAGRIGTTNGSVTSAQIQDGAISAADIGAGAVTGVKIAATNAPLAAAVKVLKTTDGGTNAFWGDDSTGGGGAIGMGPTNVISGSFTQIYYTAGFKFMSTGEIAWLENVASAGSVGIFSNGTFVANSTNINFVGSGLGQITGNTVNISGGGGGGGWDGAFVMGKYTVTANVTAVQIPVVSQTNNQLIIEVIGRCQGVTPLFPIYINGDSGAKYDRFEYYVYRGGSAGTITFGGSLGETYVHCWVDSDNVSTHVWSQTRLTIHDYTNATRAKTILQEAAYRTSNANNDRYFDYTMFTYTNTPAAITGLYITGFAGTNNIIAGTTFTLWGKD